MRQLVVFLGAHVKHYRAPFFGRLHEALKQDGVQLRVLYGSPNSHHAARWDNVELPAEYGRHVPSVWVFDRLVYQSAWKELANADLVVTPNEHKLLLNPLLLGLRAIGAKRVAFWGKGDFAASGVMQPAEWLRYKMANAVDWWFPYTEESAAHLRRLGVSCGITPIGNAVDTSELRRELSQFSDDCLRQSRYSIGISSGPVGIFCGNLSANKELDFLFAAAKRIHDAIPAFVLLVVGNGPLRQHVEIVATHERFIRYVGPRIGREKALLLALSDVFLLPGAVGLAVLDSFTAGLPLLTTKGPKHGPEVNYLEAGLNGAMTAHDVRTYADAVIRLLQNPRELALMRAEALKSATQYSLENMVENFRQGILDCLQVRARREQSELARALAKAMQSRSEGD